MCWLKISWTVRQFLNIFICFSCSSVTSSHFWAFRISSFRDISSFYRPGEAHFTSAVRTDQIRHPLLVKHRFHPTSISCGSDVGIDMCWSRHDGSLGVKIWPLPSSTSSSCKLTHNTWLCFLFSSIRWSKTEPVACMQQFSDQTRSIIQALSISHVENKKGACKDYNGCQKLDFKPFSLISRSTMANERKTQVLRVILSRLKR